MRIPVERHAIALGEARKVREAVFAFGRNRYWRMVAGGLEHAAQQHRLPLHRGTCVCGQLGQLGVGQVGSRAAEVEIEINGF